MPAIDFNGDGRSDIMWFNATTGYASNWLGTPSGGFIVNDANALDPFAPGLIAATGDFNGDGRTDTLWRNGTELHISNTFADGAFYFQWGAGFVSLVPVEWQVIGAGDFNGDGRDDILWRNQNDGRISNWLSDGDGTFTINDANAMNSLLAGWTVEGIGDFNADGRDDLIVRAADGAHSIVIGWENGGWSEEDGARLVPNEWRVAGIGDFNGDSMDDILWRNTVTGAVSNWLADGSLANLVFYFDINDANAFANVSLDWQIVGVGDYNGDGRDDVLWRNSVNGTVSNWLGTASGGWIVNDANAIRSAPLQWSIVPDPSGAGTWDY